MPQLILLDINMPKMNGLEVLHTLRQHEQTKLIPVVMLTSSKEERDIAESYRNGANSYVQKPVDFKEFAQAIGNIGGYWLVLNEPPEKFIVERLKQPRPPAPLLGSKE